MGKRLDPKEAKKVMLKANLKPLEDYKTALTRWPCECLGCGNIVYPTYNGIQQGRGGCTTCGIRRTTAARKLNESEVNSRLKLVGLQLVGEYLSIEKQLKVKCLVCKKVTTTTLQGVNRNDRNFGCENCARKASGTISNEVAVTDMKVKGLLPLEPYVGARDPWLCKCQVCFENVHITRDSIRRRSAEFKGCIDCAKKAQSDKMVSVNKDKILERFKNKNLKLRSEYINSRLPIEVECTKCGYMFITEGIRIGRQKYGCAKCSGNYVDPKEAEEFMISKGYKPTVPFLGAHLSWDSIHLLCGNAVTPQYSSIKSGSGGCKYCAEYGFQYSKPAYLYLITSERLNAHKIGIANPAKMKKSDRLYRYQHHGWSVIKIWQFQNGRLAEEVENTILLHLRVKLEIPSYLTISEMNGQGGHTETVDAEVITLIKLEKIINKVIKGLQN